MPLSSVVQPDLFVTVGGVPCAGAYEASVHANNHYAADRFAVSLALQADPALGASFWASARDVVVTVGIGDGTANQIEGLVDHVALDVTRGTARIEGRDFTSRLIEARTQETFSNRTSSEIATLLAGRHGLTADVVPTTTLVGRYYANQHDSITLGQFTRATTEWDLLVFLAQQEQFDVFVHGTTLGFRPPVQGAASRVLQPADVIDLRLERSLTLARDIEVTVKSWNTRQSRAFVQTARSSQQGSSGEPQRYVYVVPNLTTDQALTLAQRRLAALTQHERVIEFTAPGNTSLSPRDTILLQGTNTAFDQAYRIDVIDHQFSLRGGFVQTVRALNQLSAETTTPADSVQSVTGP